MLAIRLWMMLLLLLVAPVIVYAQTPPPPGFLNFDTPVASRNFSNDYGILNLWAVDNYLVVFWDGPIPAYGMNLLDINTFDIISSINISVPPLETYQLSAVKVDNSSIVVFWSRIYESASFGPFTTQLVTWPNGLLQLSAHNAYKSVPETVRVPFDATVAQPSGNIYMCQSQDNITAMALYKLDTKTMDISLALNITDCLRNTSLALNESFILDYIVNVEETEAMVTIYSVQNGTGTATIITVPFDSCDVHVKQWPSPGFEDIPHVTLTSFFFGAASLYVGQLDSDMLEFSRISSMDSHYDQTSTLLLPNYGGFYIWAASSQYLFGTGVRFSEGLNIVAMIPYANLTLSNEFTLWEDFNRQIAVLDADDHYMYTLEQSYSQQIAKYKY